MEVGGHQDPTGVRETWEQVLEWFVKDVRDVLPVRRGVPNRTP
jgi:hypothetical protein